MTDGQWLDVRSVMILLGAGASSLLLWVAGEVVIDRALTWWQDRQREQMRKWHYARGRRGLR